MKLKEVNAAIVIGSLVMAVAFGVLFASTGAPIFAATVGTSIAKAATGWLIFGGAVLIVGLIDDVKSN